MCVLVCVSDLDWIGGGARVVCLPFVSSSAAKVRMDQSLVDNSSVHSRHLAQSNRNGELFERQARHVVYFIGNKKGRHRRRRLRLRLCWTRLEPLVD